MYLEQRREWARRRKRRRKMRNLLIALLAVAAVLVSLPVISRITGRDVVKLVSEQAEKERPEEMAALQEFLAMAPATETAAETSAEETIAAVLAVPETYPQGNPALAEDWMLILVNREHPIPAGYEVPAFTELRNDNRVDSRIYPSLQQMFDDARAEGALPFITSSFRSMEKQQQLMDNKIAEYEAEGNTHEEAVRLAETWVAVPGTSEHQLGLCVDISTQDHDVQAPEVVWEWLKKNAWKYGFVQRYPEDRTDVTGIINEPWHYRYVGETAAKEMTERGLVLEEYLQQR